MNVYDDVADQSTLQVENGIYEPKVQASTHAVHTDHHLASASTT